MDKKKLIVTGIGVLILILLVFLGYKCFFNKKTVFNYSIKDGVNESLVISLDVDSGKEIEEIILPDGDSKKFDDEKEVNLKYNVDSNGDYEFTIVYKDGSKESKKINVDKFKEDKTSTSTTTTTTAKSTKKTTTTKKSSNTTTTKATTTTKQATTTTRTTTRTTTTTVPALSNVKKLSTLKVLNHDIALTDNVYEYYYYYSGTEVVPNVIYTLTSSRSTGSLTSNNLVMGDNLYTINVTAEDGTTQSYRLHVVKFDVQITFSNLTTLSNTTINTKVNTNITDHISDKISKIEYGFSSTNNDTSVVYSLYDNTLGINITETKYVYVKITTTDGNVFSEVSSLYTIDSVAPVITHFNNVEEDNILGGDNGLINSTNAVIVPNVSLPANTSFYRKNLDDTNLNLNNFNYNFTINATDNVSSTLMYSSVVTNSPITSETVWSTWGNTNTFNTLVEPYSGNDYYFGFRVKDEAGNISTVTYTLPTFKKSIPSDKCYLLSDNIVLSVIDKNPISYIVYEGDIYFNDVKVSLADTSNICDDSL